MVIVDNPYFTVKRAEAQRTERFSWGSIVSHWLSRNICAALFTWPVIPSKPSGGNLISHTKIFLSAWKLPCTIRTPVVAYIQNLYVLPPPTIRCALQCIPFLHVSLSQWNLINKNLNSAITNPFIHFFFTEHLLQIQTWACVLGHENEEDMVPPWRITKSTLGRQV